MMHPRCSSCGLATTLVLLLVALTSVSSYAPALQRLPAATGRSRQCCTLGLKMQLSSKRPGSEGKKKKGGGSKKKASLDVGEDDQEAGPMVVKDSNGVISLSLSFRGRPPPPCWPILFEILSPRNQQASGREHPGPLEHSPRFRHGGLPAR